MSNRSVLVTETHLEDIADAIRERNGSQSTYTPGQMAAAISAILPEFSAADEGKVVSSGALAQQTSRTVTDNGTYDTTTNNSVTVNVAGAVIDLAAIAEWEQGASRANVEPEDRQNYYDNKQANSARIRTVCIIGLKIGTTYEADINDGYGYSFQAYSGTDFLRVRPQPSYGGVWYSGSTTFTATEQYAALTVRKNDNSDITPSELSSAGFTLTEASA